MWSPRRSPRVCYAARACINKSRGDPLRERPSRGKPETSIDWKHSRCAITPTSSRTLRPLVRPPALASDYKPHGSAASTGARRTQLHGQATPHTALRTGGTDVSPNPPAHTRQPHIAPRTKAHLTPTPHHRPARVLQPRSVPYRRLQQHRPCARAGRACIACTVCARAARFACCFVCGDG